MKIISFFLFFVFGSSLASYSPKELKCLVCKATIQEMENKIKEVNPNKKIQVGGFRVDNSGNVEEKKVPFARSGMHLSELMDEICKTMEDYARATDKITKKLELVKIMMNGGMNPRFSEVDVIQDSDLNHSLTFYCESIVEEFEDEIYNELKQPTTNAAYNVCSKATKLCEEDQKEEL